MKKTLFAITAFAIIVIFSSSCKKDSTPLTVNQLLTQHAWKFEKTTIQQGNTQTEYIRDSVNTTGENYDISVYTFNTNGTGTLIETNGTSYPITWAFVGTDQTTMTVTEAGLTYTFSYMD